MNKLSTPLLSETDLGSLYDDTTPKKPTPEFDKALEQVEDRDLFGIVSLQHVLQQYKESKDSE